MGLTKRERSCIVSNQNEASLHLTIYEQLGDGEANQAVNPFKSPSGDSRYRGLRRCCAKHSLSVSLTHQNAFSSLTKSLTRPMLWSRSRSLDAASLQLPSGRVRCLLIGFACCYNGGGSRSFVVPPGNISAASGPREARVMEANGIHLSSTSERRDRGSTQKRGWRVVTEYLAKGC